MENLWQDQKLTFFFLGCCAAIKHSWFNWLIEQFCYKKVWFIIFAPHKRNMKKLWLKDTFLHNTNSCLTSWVYKKGMIDHQVKQYKKRLKVIFPLVTKIRTLVANSWFAVALVTSWLQCWTLSGERTLRIMSNLPSKLICLRIPWIIAS